jgi:hypothetical protein
MSGQASNAGMIRLLDQRDGAAVSVLPAARDPAAWHQALAAEIAAHLTPAHAALLAVPNRGETGIGWSAPGTAMRRYAELEAADRNRLTSAVAAILSDIRRLAESGAAPAVAAAWPAIRTIPDLTHLFAVDGRPVLAGWGFSARAGGAGPLAAMDDGIAWRAQPRVAWPVYAITLAALAAFALFAGLLLAPLAGLIVPPQAACRAAPGQLALLMEQSREAARGDALKLELAQLQEDHGDRTLQCPIPRRMDAPPAPPAAPPPAPSPPPRPAPRADLPQDRWDKHDLSMLQGCWNSYTHMMLQETLTGRPLSVKNWVYCFDGHGHGHQTITLDDGRRCENELSASFNQDNSLRMVDGARCPFARAPLFRGQLTCRRESDSQAACMRRDLEGPSTGHDQPGRFRRAEAGPPQSVPGDAEAR